uniref:Putative lipocal-1 1 n=1 Tax=Amblyomma triste TaxID=251400 RepID=A0A023GDI5_AMBTT
MILSFLRTLAFFNLLVSYIDCRREETRIDTDVMYEEHQDIYRAFNITDFYWLYGFNFDSRHTEGKRCVYFTTENLYEDKMYYASNFIKNSSWGKIEYNGTFYSTPVMHHTREQKRNVYNSLRASTRSGQWIVMNYTLIYSDYTLCSFFRVLNIDDGQGCMILLSNSTVRAGIPPGCSNLYENACAKGHSHYLRTIYDNECQPRPDNEDYKLYT